MRDENKQLKERIKLYETASKIFYNMAYENMPILYYFVKEIYPNLSKNEKKRIQKEYNITNSTIEKIINIVNNAEKTRNQEKAQTEESKVTDDIPDDNINSDYKVGYKHPPKHTRFQKGNKGNPKGRKSKKGIPVQDLIISEFDTKVDITQNGKSKKMYKREVIAKTVMKQLLNGEPVSRNNIKFITDLDKYSDRKEVMERIFNKKIK